MVSDEAEDELAEVVGDREVIVEQDGGLVLEPRVPQVLGVGRARDPPGDVVRAGEEPQVIGGEREVLATSAEAMRVQGGEDFAGGDRARGEVLA